MLFDIIRGQEEYAGLALVDGVLSQFSICTDSTWNVGRMRKDAIHPASIVRSVLFMQSMGMNHYADIEKMNHNALFNALIGRSISQESFRHRLEDLAINVFYTEKIDEATSILLQKEKIKKTPYRGREYYTLDIDVTPFSNEDTSKDGIGYTGKKAD